MITRSCHELFIHIIYEQGFLSLPSFRLLTVPNPGVAAEPGTWCSVILRPFLSKISKRARHSNIHMPEFYLVIAVLSIFEESEY